MSEQIAASRLTEQTIQSGVLAKLIFFSLALAVVPLSAYFGTQWFITPGNSIYPAAAAVVCANLILIGYIVIAVYEDQGTPKVTEAKKTQ